MCLMIPTTTVFMKETLSGIPRKWGQARRRHGYRTEHQQLWRRASPHFRSRFHFESIQHYRDVTRQYRNRQLCPCRMFRRVELVVARRIADAEQPQGIALGAGVSVAHGRQQG